MRALGKETEQKLGRQIECIYFLIHARNVVCIMPCACRPYAVGYLWFSTFTVWSAVNMWSKKSEDCLYESGAWLLTNQSYRVFHPALHSLLWLGLRFMCSASRWVTWSKLSQDTTGCLQLLVEVRMRQSKRQCGHTVSPKCVRETEAS